MKASLLDGKSQPVQDLRIVGHIKNGVCRAAFKATFENKLDHPIETSFTLPLPSGVCSTQFKVEFGDTKIVSKVARDDSARLEYDDTLAQSDFAALAQVNENNEIRIDIGTLAPNEKCKIALYFVISLTPLQNGFLLVFPTSITSFSENLRVGINPPPLSFHLDVTDTLSTITSISTPFTDNSKIECVDSKWNIDCSSLSSMHPLQVVITLSDKIIGRCLYQIFEDKTFLNIVATTPRAYRDHPTQFTIMLEDSPSLIGGQMSLIMRAIEFFIVSVPHGSKFNFCRFGMNSFKLFENPQLLTEENRQYALNTLKQNNKADGKPFVDMLKEITDKIGDAETVQSAVAIIGSSIPEETELVTGHDYFFLDPFSRGDLKKFAQTHNGCYIPVPNEATVISSILSIIKMTATAAIKDAKIVISNSQGTTEFTLPSIIPGYTFSSFSYIENAENSIDIHLKCDNLDIKFQTCESELPIINVLWAFEKMRTATPDEKLELAMANQIITPETSALVVVEREDEVEGDVSHIDARLSQIGIGWIQEKDKEPLKDDEGQPDPVPIPMPIPRPWPWPRPPPYTIRPRPPRRPEPLPRPMPFPYPEIIPMNQVVFPELGLAHPNELHMHRKAHHSLFVDRMPDKNVNPEQKQFVNLNTQDLDTNIQKNDPPPKVVQIPTKPQPPKKYMFFLLRVLQMQNANGSWSNEKGLVNSIGFPIPEETKEGLTREQFLTAFVISCIRKKAPKDEEKWELVIEKAITYLNESNSSINWDEVLQSIQDSL